MVFKTLAAILSLTAFVVAFSYAGAMAIVFTLEHWPQ